MRLPSGDQNGYLQSYGACVICADTGDDTRRVKICSVSSTSAAYAIVRPSGDQAGKPWYPGSVVKGAKVNALVTGPCGDATTPDSSAATAHAARTTAAISARLHDAATLGDCGPRSAAASSPSRSRSIFRSRCR